MHLTEGVLSARGLTFHYGRVCVWEDISLDLHRGELAFLVGVNGSGKSTLLRCLAGWTAARSGTILLDGQDFPGLDQSLRSKIAFVPDTPVFYDDLTAKEHAEFVLKANRKEAMLDEAMLLFEAFGLSKHLRQYPSSYSRGMRMKLGLALTLCLRPDVLLLDESFGPLDTRTSAALATLLLAAVERGASVLVSCHHPVPGLHPKRVFHLTDDGLNVHSGSALAEILGGAASAAEKTRGAVT